MDPSGETTKAVEQEQKIAKENWLDKMARGARYIFGIETVQAPTSEDQIGNTESTMWSSNGPAIKVGEWTDASDYMILSTGKRLDGTPASWLDKGFAVGGAVIPVVSGSALKNIVKEGLLRSVENKGLRNVIESLYKPLREGVKVIGDGSAFDAAKYTMETGIKVQGTDHVSKLKETINALNNILKREQLNATEIQIVRDLKNKASNILKGGGVK